MRKKIEEALNEELAQDVKVSSQIALNMELLDAALLPLGEEESVEKAYKALLAGADLNATFGPNGPNVLFYAATHNKEALVDWLFTASKDGKPINVNYTLDTGSSFLNGLIADLAPNHLIKKIVEHCKIDVNEKDKQGYTPLFKAIIQNNSNNVNLLLDMGADPNVLYSKNKVSPLLFASAECFSDIVVPLIKAGADIDFIDSDGHNALMYSLLRPSRALPKSKKESLKATIDYLLEETKVNVNPKTSSGASPLVYSIFSDESGESFKKLIELGADVNKPFDMGHRSRGLEYPLHFAAKRGDLKKYELLLNSGADVSKTDGFGVTSESYILLDENLRAEFMPSILEGKAKIDVNCVIAERDFENQFDAKAIKKNTVFSMLLVEALSPSVDADDVQAKIVPTYLVSYMLGNGVKKTLKDTPELHSSEPLFIAMDFANKELFDLLIKSGELDFKSKFNLGNEYQENNQNYFSHLFSNTGVKSLALAQNSYRSAVREARSETLGSKKNKNFTEEEKEEKVKEFEGKKKQLDEAMQAKKDEVFNIKVDMLETLIESGADINDSITNDGKSALFFIAETQWFNVLNSKNIDILPKDDSGFNPLDYAILKNKKSIIDGYKDVLQIPDNTLFKLAFHEFSKKDALDQETFIPRLGIIKALFSGDEYEIYNKNFKEHVFSHVPKQVNYLDESGNSPLLVATANGIDFLADLYIAMGANVNQVNENNETALQYACANNLPRLAQKLIEAGAKVDVVNTEGFTALNFAEDNGMTEQLNLMKSVLNGEVSFNAKDRKAPKI